MAESKPWMEGGGADEVPVLPHVFSEDDQVPDRTDPFLRCLRCGDPIRPTEVNDRCPARLGQKRGFTQ